jgi:hypothetical protein
MRLRDGLEFDTRSANLNRRTSMKVKISELSGTALDRAVAMSAPRATDADLARLGIPCQLWEIVCTKSEGGEGETTWSAEPITIVRFGIDEAVGETDPSVSFVDKDGRKGRGTADMFYLSRVDAELAALAQDTGGAQNFSPATNWSQARPIIERATEGNGAKPESQDLVAAMRRLVAAKLSDEVDVPGPAPESPAAPARRPRM